MRLGAGHAQGIVRGRRKWTRINQKHARAERVQGFAAVVVRTTGSS